MTIDRAPTDAQGTRARLRDELSMLMLELGVAGLALAAAVLLAFAR